VAPLDGITGRCTMWSRPTVDIQEHTRRFGCPARMRKELKNALAEALYELDVLPDNEDGAILGLYAVMDDIKEAIRRTETLDRLPH